MKRVFVIYIYIYIYGEVMKKNNAYLKNVVMMMIFYGFLVSGLVAVDIILGFEDSAVQATQAQKK